MSAGAAVRILICCKAVEVAPNNHLAWSSHGDALWTPGASAASGNECAMLRLQPNKGMRETTMNSQRLIYLLATVAAAPPDQAEGTYYYLVAVDQLGTLDPRVEV